MAWAKRNRDRVNAREAARRQANPAAFREASLRYHHKNKDKRSKDHAAWAKRNIDKRRATCAKRVAARLRAIPVWADHESIAAFYADATSRPGRWHVDHIVPLQGETVCGLHCQANLQVILGSENESKRNRWWPDMFEVPR